MTDELDLDLRDALRAEAFRPPLLLTGDALRARLEDAERRRARQPWNAALAGAAALAILVAAIAFTPIGGGPSGRESPTPSAACNESPATKHGSWWVEMGGPNAFFNIEPDTRTGVGQGATWLLFVRFDPDAGPRTVLSLAAEELSSGDRVTGTLNSPADPSNIFRFDEPAPSLPGGWYLFELPIRSTGCWRIEAMIDNVVVGSAIVDVRWGSRAPVDPSGPSPQIEPSLPTSGTRLGVEGVATGCFSIGGCGYFAELVGSDLRVEAQFRGVVRSPEPDGGVFDYRPVDLVLEEGLPSSLAPGPYVLTLTAFAFSDAIVSGQPRERFELSRCSVTFTIGPMMADVLIRATFSADACAAVVQPEQ